MKTLFITLLVSGLYLSTAQAERVSGMTYYDGQLQGNSKTETREWVDREVLGSTVLSVGNCHAVESYNSRYGFELMTREKVLYRYVQQEIQLSKHWLWGWRVISEDEAHFVEGSDNIVVERISKIIKSPDLPFYEEAKANCESIRAGYIK